LKKPFNVPPKKDDAKDTLNGEGDTRSDELKVMSDEKRESFNSSLISKKKNW
jgi:hypothetical protein